jgi:hypothetical protein
MKKTNTAHNGTARLRVIQKSLERAALKRLTEHYFKTKIMLFLEFYIV